MSGNPNFQDWDTVVFRKKPTPQVKTKKKGSTTVPNGAGTNKNRPNPEASRLRKLDESEEAGKHKTVSLTLRQAISQGRSEKGMKQKELANLLNVKSTVIQDYESGKAIPDGRLLARMERVLGVKLTGKQKDQGKKLRS